MLGVDEKKYGERPEMTSEKDVREEGK